MSNTDNIFIIENYDYINTENVIIFSPLFPFNNDLIKSFVKKSKTPVLTIDLFSFYRKYKYVSFDVIYEQYVNIINSKFKDFQMDFVCFGPFSNLFTKLFIDLQSEYEIKNFVLVEPDLTNIIYLRFLRNNFSLFFKKRELSKYFYQGKKIIKKYESKLAFKCLLSYFDSKDIIYFNKEIYKLLDKSESNVYIYWSIFKKETWPLAQVLSEQYNFNLNSINDNLYNFFDSFQINK